MIDPRKVTNFERTPEELEEFLLFAIVVAGKSAFQQAAKLEQFLTISQNPFARSHSPFGLIRHMEHDKNNILLERLRAVKMGQYERVSTAFRGVAHFLAFDEDYSHCPLYNVSVDLLASIKGIGMKTARFFAMHTRPNVEYACLDTHILKWLGKLGYEVPKTTPRGEKYLELERVFLLHCKEVSKSPAELDLEIWNSQHLENTSKKNLTTAYTSVIVAV